MAEMVKAPFYGGRDHDLVILVRRCRRRMGRGVLVPPLGVKSCKFEIIRALNPLFSLISYWTQIDFWKLAVIFGEELFRKHGKIIFGKIFRIRREDALRCKKIIINFCLVLAYCYTTFLA